MEATFQDCLREAKARGQTVFLSSHILSEVEAVCDRVAVLRQGVLVEHGTLDGPAPPARPHRGGDLRGRPAACSTGMPGVEDVYVHDGVIRLQVTGSTDPLLKALAAAHVPSILMREPSLEELFHAFYDESADVPAGTAW
jgi:ABC-2 type transport system ATP-binding protein